MNRELATTLESLHPDAFGWALHCSDGDYGRAEEVLQNAYLKLVRNQLQPTGGSTVKTWWFGVIRFTAMEEYRKAKFRSSFLGKLISQFVPDSAAEGDPSPSRQLELNEEGTYLRSLLQQLSPRQAEILHLVFYQDLPLSEAATVMQISLGSARQHYERVKQRLLELYQPNHEPLPL